MVIHTDTSRDYNCCTTNLQNISLPDNLKVYWTEFVWKTGALLYIHILCKSYLKSKSPPSPLECGLGSMSHFQRIECGKGKTVTLQWRKLVHATSSKWWRLTSLVMSYACHIPLMYERRRTLHLWHSFQKPINPSSSWEKHKTNRNWGTLYKIPGQALQNCQGHEKQGKTEKLSQPEDIKET